MTAPAKPNEHWLDLNRSTDLFSDSMKAVRELTRAAAGPITELDDRAAVYRDVVRQASFDIDDETIARSFELLDTATQQLLDKIESVRSSNEEGVAPSQAQMQQVVLDWLNDRNNRLQELVGEAVDTMHLENAWASAKSRMPRSVVMYSSLLTTAVGSFEVLFQSCLRTIISINPELLNASDSKYAFKDVMEFDSLAQFREYCAEAYIDNVMRGGYRTWLDWLQKKMKIQLSDLALDDAKHAHMGEIFQRRHLFVHNGGVVNKFYLNNVADEVEVPELNVKLSVDADYVIEAIHTLTVVGIVLSVRTGEYVARKTRDTTVNPHGRLIGISFDLLKDGDHAVCKTFSLVMAKIVDDDLVRLMLTVNAWIARRELYGAESIRAEVEEWQTAHLSGNFQLAKLILLEKYEAADEKVRSMLEADELSTYEFQTWPLFSGLRTWRANAKRDPSGGTVLALEDKSDETRGSSMDRP